CGVELPGGHGPEVGGAETEEAEAGGHHVLPGKGTVSAPASAGAPGLTPWLDGWVSRRDACAEPGEAGAMVSDPEGLTPPTPNVALSRRATMSTKPAAA